MHLGYLMMETLLKESDAAIHTSIRSHKELGWYP
jgi:hypothetical protein